MRIRDIDVRGFGRLRDFVASFNPRVTVIFGENETGKSTLHRVIRAGFYGLDAGGQGRAVERSDWSRWAPWSAGPYGFALTVETQTGQVLRIAASLDSREQRIQVVEVGGGDITAAMRHGRLVAPGRHLLGIDEAVFCATAWLGDDSLRLSAPDSASQRTPQLQEAIERLADSGRNTTAATAIAALQQAADRVGSERRVHSPLGAVTQRIRQLEEEMERLQRQRAAVAGDMERLRRLEAAADEARAQQRECERDWILGRLAALGAERLEAQRAGAHAAELSSVVAATSEFATFPIEDEATVLALSGQWRQAFAAADEAQKRWTQSAAKLNDIVRRRAEIAAGLAALGTVAAPDDATIAQAHSLASELASATANSKRLVSVQTATARIDALRRELASTGLGTLSGDAADEAAASLQELDHAHGALRLRAQRPLSFAAGGATLAAIGLGATHHNGGTIAAAVIALLSSLAVVALWIAQRQRPHTERTLLRLFAGADLSDPLVRAELRERLAAVAALQREIVAQESRAAVEREQQDAIAEEITQLRQRAERLATQCDIDIAAAVADSGTFIEIVVAEIESRITAAQRRAELLAEDGSLESTQSALEAVRDEANKTRTSADVIRTNLCRRLGVAPDIDNIDAAVAAFSEGCEKRRVHDSAAAQLAALRPRVREDDSDARLADLAARLSRDLVERGGDPAAVATATTLDPAALNRLEREADAARRRVTAAELEAAQLRSRLEAARGGTDIADVEDELNHCRAVRARALHQRAALQRAIETLEATTRVIHRELAPRLAESMQSRLALLTDSRYEAVNVDTDRFAISLIGRERAETVPLEHTSHGTRDQVALLLRVALADVLSDSGEPIPLLLDEPLLSSDPTRRGLLLSFLADLSEEHQVVVTTTDPDVVEQILAQLGQAASVISLPAVSRAGVIESAGVATAVTGAAEAKAQIVTRS